LNLGDERASMHAYGVSALSEKRLLIADCIFSACEILFPKLQNRLPKNICSSVPLVRELIDIPGARIDLIVVRAHLYLSRLFERNGVEFFPKLNGGRQFWTF
jgi:hypothetical protein